MSGRLDLTGRHYGNMVVVDMLYNYNNKHRTFCRCVGEDGTEAIIRADALQSGATKNIKHAGENRKDTNIEGQKFGLLTAIKPTENRSSNGCVIWECICDCGNTTYVSFGNLMRKHTLSCGCWHKSKWEMFITDFLQSIGVKFKEEKRFDDCRNKSGTDTLPFDFYLIDYNIIIEYDGEHHFFPIEGWGGEEKFKITQENDEIKNNYCKEHDIKLLRLPYTLSEDKIKQEILNILSPVTITV